MFRLCTALLLAGLVTACVDDATASDTSAVANAQGSGCHRPPLPQAALDACANLTAGASCAFDIDSHHVTGTCRQGPSGNGPLACAPDQPPPNAGSGDDCGPPQPPQAALDACANSSAGASCAFDIDSHHITGTCRQPPSGALVCAPDGGGQPPR